MHVHEIRKLPSAVVERCFGEISRNEAALYYYDAADSDFITYWWVDGPEDSCPIGRDRAVYRQTA